VISLDVAVDQTAGAAEWLTRTLRLRHGVLEIHQANQASRVKEND